MQRGEAIILSPQISASYSGQQGMVEDGAFVGGLSFYMSYRHVRVGPSLLWTTHHPGKEFHLETLTEK